MNYRLILSGILFIFIAIIFITVTYGFGVICIWPLFILGVLLCIIGLITPSQKTFFHTFTNQQQNQSQEMKRICTNCKKTVPMNLNQCPHCGHRFKY